MEQSTAYHKGYAAFNHGDAFDSNPYQSGTQSYWDWQSGYDQAEVDVE